MTETGRISAWHVVPGADQPLLGRQPSVSFKARHVAKRPFKFELSGIHENNHPSRVGMLILVDSGRFLRRRPDRRSHVYARDWIALHKTALEVINGMFGDPY
jgi:hypothetical protein